MVKNILLNDNPFDISISDLPCLINGTHGAGSSLFTMTSLANLYSQGYKILCLSAYSMARAEFISQVGETEDIALITTISTQQQDLKKEPSFFKRTMKIRLLSLLRLCPT